MPQVMDTRLIFRDLLLFRWSDEVQYAVRIIGFDVSSVRISRRKIRAVVFDHKSKLEGNLERKLWKVCKARFQEKLLRLNKSRPYRKPTQVVRASSPRRTSEMSPRNSAKKRPYLRYKAFPEHHIACDANLKHEYRNSKLSDFGFRISDLHRA